MLLFGPLPRTVDTFTEVTFGKVIQLLMLRLGFTYSDLYDVVHIIIGRETAVARVRYRVLKYCTV